MKRTLALAVLLGGACGNEPGEESELTSATAVTTADGSTSTTDSGASATESTATQSGSVSQSGTDSDGMDCGEVDFVLEAVPPNVALVLDKSGSMVSTADVDMDMVGDGFWDHDADPMTTEISRWNSLYNVVDFVVTGFENSINFGAVLFPSLNATNAYSAQSCPVRSNPEVPVAAGNAMAILGAIPSPMDTTLAGATPATAGIQTAIDHLQGLDPEVPRFMILVTDGAANCSSDFPSPPDLLENYDQNLPDLVGDAFSTMDIPTYVVGIDIADELAGAGADGVPEANTFVELNTVATAGGRALAGDEKFFNTINEIELQAALEEIAGQVVSCVIPLDPPPQFPGFVEVDIAGTSIPAVTDCTSEDGWVFTDPDGPYDAIELCGSACEILVDAGAADVTYGCPPAG